MAHSGHELLDAPGIDELFVIWLCHHIKQVVNAEIRQKLQVEFHLFQFKMEQDFHLKQVRKVSFEIAHQPFVRSGPVCLVRLGSLSSQLRITDW